MALDLLLDFFAHRFYDLVLFISDFSLFPSAADVSWSGQRYDAR